MISKSMIVLGIDPGRQKTGLAVLDEEGTILWNSIVPTDHFSAEINNILTSWPITLIALGHSTGSQDAKAAVEQVLERWRHSACLEIIDERNSTLQARELYFEAHPPLGWRRLVPLSLQVPPVPIDDFAAAVLARRAIEKLRKE